MFITVTYLHLLLYLVPSVQCPRGNTREPQQKYIQYQLMQKWEEEEEEKLTADTPPHNFTDYGMSLPGGCGQHTEIQHCKLPPSWNRLHIRLCSSLPLLIKVYEKKKQCFMLHEQYKIFCKRTYNTHRPLFWQ